MNINNNTNSNNDTNTNNNSIFSKGQQDKLAKYA